MVQGATDLAVRKTITVAVPQQRAFDVFTTRMTDWWLRDSHRIGEVVPEAVVINLGTNDFSTGDPGPEFQTIYLKFVTDLRGHYPSARFFLAVGTMLSGDPDEVVVVPIWAVDGVACSQGHQHRRPCRRRPARRHV